MGEKTGISWTHHTFNAWWGCTKVSPECQRCYAERDSKRFGFQIWGDQAERRFFGDKHWNEPLKWNAAAEKAGERRRVFTNSMADVFEERFDLVQPRARLFDLIKATPHLDWLLLTKRAENIVKMLPDQYLDNVWLGTTAGTQERLKKQVPLLRDFADQVPVLWVSAEPLLESLLPLNDYFFIDWWVVGGESGPGCRPMRLEWAREIRDCTTRFEGDAKFFFKQVGGLRPKDNGDLLDGREYKAFPAPA